MSQEIKFPIMNLTEFAFEIEKVFFSHLTWEPECILKDKYLKKISEWKYVDADGKLLKAKILKKKKIDSLWSFLIKPSYELEIQLLPTGKIYQLEELKKEILLKKNEMFHIYYNKLISISEYETKLDNANTFLEIIDIASFEDYKEYNSG